MLNQKVMFLFARTPVHVGAGNSVGAVDAPVMRERHTDIPVIPGTSLKGVLSDLWNERGSENKMVRSAVGVGLFGSDSKAESLSAGSLLIGEGSVLAFPVRSAKNAFAWITCPMVLKKFARNAGVSLSVPSLDGAETCYGSKELVAGGSIVLEEYCLSCKGDASSVAQQLMACTFSDELWDTVKSRLAIVSDEMFSFFVRNACEVVTRVRIDDDTHVVSKGALFNQEQVPSETLFYSVLGEQSVKCSPEGGLDALEAKVKDVSVIQVGGDATVGLGFCQVFFKEVK